MPGWLLFLASLAYAAVLFFIAWRVERSRVLRAPRSVVYALSIAVYCTSWTFFGAVGTATSEGWNFLPIYLGPVLIFVFGSGLLRRLVAAVRRDNLSSLSDLISSRYGKSRTVAAMVAVLAILGVVPYIALQLRSLGTTAADLMGHRPQDSDTAILLLMAASLAAFAIMFGARRYDATARNPGLVAAIAFESVVKLVALGALGVFACALLVQLPSGVLALGQQKFAALFAADQLNIRFVTITLLSMCAIVCLPRQFYVGVIECADASYLNTARWLVPAYMIATSVLVAPIALAGLASLPGSVAPDLFVLELPLAHGARWLALVAFLGGFSAATGMVVVESVALATMISNDLVAPLLLRAGGVRPDRDYGGVMLTARRLSIVGVIALACLFDFNISGERRLADIGLVSFAAVAQFAPALLGALFWPKGNQIGARWGLGAGLLLWAYTLLLPTLVPEGALDRVFGDGAMLHPERLFGVAFSDSLTHGVFWSLLANAGLYVLGSRAATTSVAERMRAAQFTPQGLVEGVGPATSVGDLSMLAERFVGAQTVREHLGAISAERGRPLRMEDPLDVEVARETERLIGRVIGASSARVIVTSALRRGSLDVADVASLLGDAKESLHFSRELLFATLENLSQGVSVVDKDLRLVAWNARYIDLFDFPPGFIHVGRPIADVIRFNALNGECGPGGVESHVARRLANYARGAPHTYERVRPNGMVLKSTGNPMPGGGYVTSFTDITEESRARDALRLANETLEARVAERTLALSKAKQAADEATIGKTKFLAAASHDLLQPLNAARLFAAALSEATRDRPDSAKLVGSIERSIAAADGLLRALLDISKLDAGGVVAAPTVFRVAPLLEELADQFAPLAAEKRLALRVAPSSLVVETDRTLLRSALQNFLSNAVRYTSQGGVVIGARPVGGRVRIEVWDTGVGVPDDKRAEIFQEFRRLQPGLHRDGVGLGLAIVERIARILDASATVRSRVGRGSVFAIDVPRTHVAVAAPQALAATASVAGVRVLCVDNEREVLRGLEALLLQWGAAVRTAGSYEAAMEACADAFDVALVDYHLAEDKTGLDILAELRRRHPAMRLALVTADAGPVLAEAAGARGGVLIPKPVDALVLKAFLADALRVSTDIGTRSEAPT